ncbi:hypothetical protein JOL62DRAFT_437233 [Phyllosticta paracitricarpa]|uniref:Uncharacterized protein n=2 Tax=Phyllosticta TaxID=121621 RepID=A0ABR1MK67_9PEZI
MSRTGGEKGSTTHQHRPPHPPTPPTDPPKTDLPTLLRAANLLHSLRILLHRATILALWLHGSFYAVDYALVAATPPPSSQPRRSSSAAGPSPSTTTSPSRSSSGSSPSRGGTSFYTTYNALVVDVFPASPSSAAAAAAASVVRCAMAAAAVAVLQPLVEVAGRGWYFTVLGIWSGVCGGVGVWVMRRKGMGVEDGRGGGAVEGVGELKFWSMREEGRGNEKWLLDSEQCPSDVAEAR